MIFHYHVSHSLNSCSKCDLLEEIMAANGAHSCLGYSQASCSSAIIAGASGHVRVLGWLEERRYATRIIRASAHKKHISFGRRRKQQAMCLAAAASAVAVEDPEAASSSTKDVNTALKAELLSVVAGLDRGLLASEDDVEAAEGAARRLEGAGSSIEFPRDLDKLQGRWRLVYSSAFASGNLGGSRPGPPAFRLPLQLGQVYQRIDVLGREFDNIVDLRIPTPWPLPPFETRATLAHTFGLTGEAGIKIIFDKTYVKALGAFSELPPLDLPRLPDFLSSSSVNARSGQFDVTYIDGDLRITRGDRGELRIFVKL